MLHSLHTGCPKGSPTVKKGKMYKIPYRYDPLDAVVSKRLSMVIKEMEDSPIIFRPGEKVVMLSDVVPIHKEVMVEEED